MAEVPKHITDQIAPLAADGMSVDEIAFMLRLDQKIIRQHLRPHSGAAAQRKKVHAFARPRKLMHAAKRRNG